MLLITIAEELEKTRPPGTVISYFFCQGTNSKLNNATAVLRGLIYRLVDQKPSLISYLRKKYDKSGENLFNDENAFFALSDILKEILRDPNFPTAYVLIDALDECEKELGQLLRLIVDNSSASSRVKWIVSSRNRDNIERQLEPGNSKMKLSLEITQNAEQVSLAVDTYIDFKITKVRSLQGDDELKDKARRRIRKKANGTFLWAALVIQQLEDEDVPKWDVLDVIEELPPGLNGIYGRMLDYIKQHKRKYPEYCQRVLLTTALAYRPLDLTEMAVLSGLPQDISRTTEGVRSVVDMCGSFLTVLNGYVYLVHQSAKDYLSGEGSNSFPFDLANVHLDICLLSLRSMSTLRRDNYDLKDPGVLISEIKVPDPDPLAAMRYSCVYWIDHYCDFYGSAQNQSHSVDSSAISQFLQEKFIYWFEAMSLIQHMNNAVLAIRRLDNMLEDNSSLGKLRTLVHDIRRFIQQNEWLVENAPLQTYASALIFSPTNCLTREIFQKDDWDWIKIKPKVEPFWGRHIETLQVPETVITSIVFSHDCKLLASVSASTIKIWYTATRFLIHVMECGRRLLAPVVFSYDSKLLAVGLDDWRVKIWDTETGCLVKEFGTFSDITIQGFTLGFSPNFKLLAAGMDKIHGTIKIWDTENESPVKTLVFTRGSEKRFDVPVAFSHDLKLLAAGDDEAITIWDTESWLLRTTLDSDHGAVSQVRFSRNSKILVSVAGDIFIEIWNLETESLQHTFDGHNRFGFMGYDKNLEYGNDGASINAPTFQLFY
ncbi:hypothetical protein GGR52DRAFT_447049 [Hypoxylon sp. FL1284]|nr:hypothetical protein GGR52DRAFT_447049 [Hypoxylon sp. FL1284]